MLTLHAAATSNGLRASILLEELGLPYDLRKVDLAKGDQRTPEFLALNPAGQIPVLVDSNGPDGQEVVLDQSGAILMYLAEKEDKFLPDTAADHARFLPIYLSILTDLGPTVGTVFAITRMQEPHGPTQAVFAGRVGGYLRIYDDRLIGRRYIAGDELTIADFALFAVILRMGQVTPDLVRGYGNLERWAAEFAARPGVQRGIAALG